MKLSKFKIASWIAVLALVPHLAKAQAQLDQSAMAPADKLQVETIASVPIQIRQKLLSQMDEHAREKFAQQFRELPASGASNAKINALFMAWGALDPVAAITNAKTFSTPDTRRVGVEALLYGMKPEEAGKVAPLIRGFADDFLPPGQKQRFLGISIVKWSQADPPAAARFFAEVYPGAGARLVKPGGGDGDLIVAIKGVATNWGAASPQAALEWLHDNVKPESVIAKQDLVMGWRRKDAKAAFAYLCAHTATPVEQEVAGAMAALMADQDPRVCLQWVEWIKDERSRRQTRLEIAELWARHDPIAAAEWARGLSGKEANGPVAVVAGVWAISDGPAAEKWIQTLKTPIRDAGIRGYAISTSGKDPKGALAWVTKMKDRNVRMRLMFAIASEWSKENPTDSKAWVEQNRQLSDADKKRLLSGEID